jgi:hypothetical protein
MHEENLKLNQLWRQNDARLDTAAHYVNPTITTCNTSAGTAYTATSLGLTDSTQA